MERRREPNKSPVARIHDPMELEDGMTKFCAKWQILAPGCAQHSLDLEGGREPRLRLGRLRRGYPTETCQTILSRRLARRCRPSSGKRSKCFGP